MSAISTNGSAPTRCSLCRSGKLFLRAREKVIAGEVPGIKTQWDLFRDSWGHVHLPVQVLDAYCHFAVIYRRSPVGLPLPQDLVKANNPNWDDKLNRLLQELAWDAVTHHPLSGVHESAAAK